jgi:hypothetical protein
MSRSSWRQYDLITTSGPAERAKYEVLAAENEMRSAMADAKLADDKKKSPAEIESKRLKFEKAATKYFNLHWDWKNKYEDDRDTRNEDKRELDRKYAARPQLGMGVELPDSPDLYEVPLYTVVDKPLEVPGYRPDRSDDYKEEFFKDSNGKIRPATPDERTRIAVQRSYHKAMPVTMESFIKSGKTVDSETGGSFRRIVKNKLDQRYGITPNTPETSEAILSETLMLHRDKAHKLLKDNIHDHYRDHAHPLLMAAPAGGDEPSRRDVLRELKMDPAILTPTLEEFREKLVSYGSDSTKWQTLRQKFLSVPSAQGNAQINVDTRARINAQVDELHNLVKSYITAKNDVDEHKHWAIEMNTWRQGEGGKEVLKQAKICRYMNHKNNTVKQLKLNETPMKSASIAMSSAIGMTATMGAFPVGGGEVKKAEVGTAIHNRITDAYEKKGADVPSEIKAAADLAKQIAETAIEEGNTEIREHADNLKTVALSSRDVCREIFNTTNLDILSPAAVASLALVPVPILGFDATVDETPRGIANKFAIAAKNAFLKSEGHLNPADPGIPILTMGNANLVRDILRQTLIEATADNNADLCSNDITLKNNARTRVARSVAVANSLTVIALKKPALKTGLDDDQLSLMVREAAAQARHGKTAVQQVIRRHIEAVVPAGGDALLRQRKIDSRVNDFAESIDIGFGISDGEKAVREVQNESEPDAVVKMTPIIQHQTMAKDLMKRLSTQSVVNETVIREQYRHTRNHTNKVLDKIFLRVQAVRHTLGIGASRYDNLYENIQKKLRQNYLSNNFTTADRLPVDVIKDIISQEVRAYNDVRRTHAAPGVRYADLVLDNHQLTAAATSLFGDTKILVDDRVAHPGRPFDIQPLSEESLLRLAGAGQQAFNALNIVAKKAEKGVEAAALGAGVGSDQAKAAGNEAKTTINSGASPADAGKAAASKLRKSKNLSGTAVVAAMASDGDPAATTGAIISNHPQDEMIAEANLLDTLAYTLKLSNTNFSLAGGADEITDADIGIIIGEAKTYYRTHGTIDKTSFLALTRVAAILGGTRVNALNAVGEALSARSSVQKGMEFGKEAKIAAGTRGGDMAEIVGGVASITGVGKAVGMEIALQLGKRFPDSKSAPIDHKTALQDIDTAVAQVNARAHALEQKASELAEADLGDHSLGTLGLSAANSADLAEHIKKHYLENGSISVSDVRRIIDERGGIAGYGFANNVAHDELIRSFHSQIQSSADDAVPAPGDPQSVKISVLQKNALAKTAEVFSNDKVDTVAAGSGVAGAFVRAPASDLAGQAEDRIMVTSLATLVGHGVSQRDGAKGHPPTPADPSDVSNAVGEALVGLRAASIQAGKIGSAASAGAAAGSAFYRNYRGTLTPPQARTELEDAMRAVEPDGGGPLSIAIRTAVIQAVDIARLALPGGVSADATTKALSVAAALAAAAVKAGYSVEDAKLLAAAVAQQAVIARDVAEVDEKLHEQVALISRVRLSSEKIKELATVARGAFALGHGIVIANGAPGVDETQGQRVFTIVTEIAMASGVSAAEAKAAAQDALEALDKPDTLLAGAPPFTDPLNAEQARKLAALASASLTKAGHTDGAFAVSSALVQIFDSSVIANKAKSVSMAAGASQVTDSERQSEPQPEGLPERGKKLKSGQGFAEDLVLDGLKTLRMRQDQMKDKEPKKQPKPDSFDTHNFLEVGNNLSKPETWLLKFDFGEEGPKEKTLEQWAQDDPDFKQCLDDLKACVDDEGKNLATADTLIEAIQKYNDSIKPYEFWKTRIDTRLDGGDIKKNGKGGIKVTLRNMGMSDTKDLLKSWAEISMEKKKNTKDINRARAGK